ncbi:MAG: branched-chain amino acid ABC transporter permease [bacterium]
MEFIGQTILNALITSSFYALVAVGLTLVFGVMKIVNFAHGEFYMLGAYAVWVLFAVNKWPYFAAVVVGIVVAGLLGAVSERVIFRPLRGNLLSGFIASVGLVFILQVAVGRIWGVGKMKPVPAPYPGAVVSVGGVSVDVQRIIAFGGALVLVALLLLFLSRSRMGRALRASSQDSEAAALQGISVGRTSAIAMLIGSAMAGAAGTLMAPIMSVYPYMGGLVIWMAFVIVIVGGQGKIKGAIYAAVMFGFLNTIITTLLDSTIAQLAIAVFMLIFLAIRPQGLLGHAE